MACVYKDIRTGPNMATEIRRTFVVRVIQDGVRDASITSQYRADESGGWIWEASNVCEAAIVKLCTASAKDWEDMRVLELGSGTGWLALRVARLGARVTATDRGCRVAAATLNVLRNQKRAFTADGEQALRVAVVALDWEEERAAAMSADAAAASEVDTGDEGDELRGRFDLVIGSDLIYNREMHEPLLATLRRRAPDGTPCVLSWEERKPHEEAAFLALAREPRYGFACELVHQTTSTVNGRPIYAYCLRRASSLPPRPHVPAPVDSITLASEPPSACTPSACTPSSSSGLLQLPTELLRAVLSQLLSPSDVLRAGSVCVALCNESRADELWKGLMERRWPAWTLLTTASATEQQEEATAGGYAQLTEEQEQEEEEEEKGEATTFTTGAAASSSFSSEGSSSAFALYIRRHRGEGLTVRASAVLVLTGTAFDSYDGNRTPMEVALCRAPPGGLSARLGIPSHGLLAEVSFHAGSLHNEPVRKTWLGEVVSMRSSSATSSATARAVAVEWREHSTTFGHWVYEGTIAADGRSIRGRFWLNVLPRKCGTFELHACDPSGAEGPVPSPQALATRVLLRWAHKAVAKKAAQSEVLAEAALLG